MKIKNKIELKPGDLIFFHNWGVGGFLFGIVIENDKKDEYYHNKLKVWRARSTFYFGPYLKEIIKNRNTLNFQSWTFVIS